MNVILFDDDRRVEFLPLVYTKPVSDLLSGIFSNRQRWESHLGSNTSTLTEDYLQSAFPLVSGEDNLLINGRLLPGSAMYKEVIGLEKGEKLMSNDVLLALRVNRDGLDQLLKPGKYSRLTALLKSELKVVKSEFRPDLLGHVWDLFRSCGNHIQLDLERLDQNQFKNHLGQENVFLGERIFIHKSAQVNASTLNSKEGPIIVDEGAEIMEGCSIRGPLYLGKGSILKMGAKIYGPVSIGDHCKVGGEVNNSVINSYSNKGHDGFLGNSVIGSWCNLGADTNNSNLKNDYSDVKLWSFEKASFVKSGLQFLGLIMGDHSKCGINTMFNTGTVAGVFCNIYGAGFQPNFIPSFSWGKPGAFMTYQFEKAIDVAQRVMDRRNIALSAQEEKILRHVFDHSQTLREKFNKTT
ncbi:MAG: GlmU family protein [Vicingaceae bacterium]